MEALATVRRQPARQPRLQLLVADADARLRSLLASQARALAAGLVVLEAVDGAEAVQLALQREPQLALLDVSMPRLGGVEVAMTLRELRPELRVALRSADPLIHRQQARECRLPLFDKLDLDPVVDWVELHARALAGPRALQPGRSLECSACGYGIAHAVPPERCPMCRRQAAWVDPRRRFR